MGHVTWPLVQPSPFVSYTLTKIPAKAIFCGIASTTNTKYINAATTFIFKLFELMLAFILSSFLFNRLGLA